MSRTSVMQGKRVRVSLCQGDFSLSFEDQIFICYDLYIHVICVCICIQCVYVCHGMNVCRGQSKILGSEFCTSIMASQYKIQVFGLLQKVPAELSCQIFLPFPVSSYYLLIQQSGGGFPIHSFSHQFKNYSKDMIDVS